MLRESAADLDDNTVAYAHVGACPGSAGTVDERAAQHQQVTCHRSEILESRRI
jgi:hypothetical protein